MKSGLRRSLALALGLCTLTVGASAASVTFRDVPSSYWGYSHITKAASNGLVSGLGDGVRPLVKAVQRPLCHHDLRDVL